jgi:hypothetical protein
MNPKEPQMEQQPPPPAPADLNAPYVLRMMLIRRYRYLTLKFSNPIISESDDGKRHGTAATRQRTPNPRC